MKTLGEKIHHLAARVKRNSWTGGSRGATAIEYALIIMTVALVIIAGAGSFGAAVANLYMRIVESIF
jgi:Flp pilus assembly pilin Flp